MKISKKNFIIFSVFSCNLFLMQNIFADSQYYPRTVIGEDKRVRFSSNEYPWTTFGLVMAKDRAYCTGTLVGPRLVITNAHCVNFSSPISFFPSYNNGDFLDTFAYQIKAIKLYAPNNLVTDLPLSAGASINYQVDNDWAILVLEEPIGEQFKWLDVLPWDNKFLNTQSIFNFSYGDAGEVNKKGEYPLLNEKCTIHENYNNYLWHDCATGFGSSGSSLVTTIDDKAYIVGLHNGGTGMDTCPSFALFKCGNLAVETNKFIEVLEKARAENK